MQIKKAGLVKTTLIDYPGIAACSVFLPGCNLKCPYCHNPDLVLGNTENLLPLENIIDHLEKRKDVLKGVCITGGEPFIHTDLPELVNIIKNLGYKIKIDTNGTFPDKLAECKADYIAMDIKTVPEKYYLLAGSSCDSTLPEKIKESIRLIINSSMKYEFRTTLVPGIVSLDDMRKISEITGKCEKYTLNRFRPENTLSKEWEKTVPYSEDNYLEFLGIVKSFSQHAKIRGF